MSEERGVGLQEIIHLSDVDLFCLMYGADRR
jgi:hypothetical protein